jgi:hypothetical protein
MTSAAAKYLWDLLCDLPSQKRRGIRLVMLRAYFDESGTGQPPVFTLGGFIASSEQWAKFTDAWQTVLDMPLKLDYFKLDDAIHFKGPFSGWSVERRNERILLLNDVIAEHVATGFCFTFNLEDFEIFFKNNVLVQWPYNSVYYFGVMSLILSLGDNRRSMGIDSPIQLIFDDGVKEKSFLQGMWDYARSDTEWADRMNTIGSPYFLDDKQVLPLQAADMMAGLGRYHWMARYRGQPYPLPNLIRDPTRPVIHTSNFDRHDFWEFLKQRNQRAGRFVSYTFGNLKGFANSAHKRP